MNLDDLYNITTSEPDRVRKVAEAIDPIHFNMGWWLSNHEDEACFVEDIDRIGSINNCGTSACIAGWAVLTFKDLANPRRSIDLAAREILGLNSEDSEYLFTSDFGATTAKEILMAIANNGDRDAQ